MTASAPPARWWQWPTILSLDAPLVVAVWQWLFGAVAGVPIGWRQCSVVLASVWLAYAADRWLEANRLVPANILTPRHWFYRKHRRWVAIVWLLVLIADLTVALRELSRRELLAGALLLVPTLLYVLSHQFVRRDAAWRLPKEFWIAVLIAGGASVFVLAPEYVDARRMLWPVAMFAAVCFCNVSLISAWESQIDSVHGQQSLARQFEHGAAISHSLPFLVTAFAAVAGAPVFGIPEVPAHCVAASGVLLVLVDRYEAKLGWQLARVLADTALLTPIIPLVRSHTS